MIMALCIIKQWQVVIWILYILFIHSLWELRTSSYFIFLIMIYRTCNFKKKKKNCVRLSECFLKWSYFKHFAMFFIQQFPTQNEILGLNCWKLNLKVFCAKKSFLIISTLVTRCISCGVRVDLIFFCFCVMY